ncbi:hypothetical protein B566_EDAN006183 [Ephemera danica]|nr:hypothetical protein B566_EDAN006183 [Ephemera danica]
MLSGHTATHAVVFAQLLTPDGRSHGMHCFYVQIRDPNTLHALPGITIGDMGEKLGLNAIDNGFMVFNNYRVPKASLLDRTGSVGRDGRYVTPYKDSKKRFGASLTSLLSGRMAITGFCSSNLSKSMVIAVRYSAVRRQFAPAGQEQELPVLSYQSHVS